jgi:hypothetical protein
MEHMFYYLHYAFKRCILNTMFKRKIEDSVEIQLELKKIRGNIELLTDNIQAILVMVNRLDKGKYAQAKKEQQNNGHESPPQLSWTDIAPPR